MLVLRIHGDRGTRSTQAACEEDPASGATSDGAGDQERRELSRVCRYGEETYYRSGSAQDRNDGIPVVISLAHPPAIARLNPPLRTKPQPGVCTRGGGPCDKPARPYPGGWGCEEHRPAAPVPAAP